MTKLKDAVDTLKAIKAMQEDGHDVYCPRCGQKHRDGHRALSRHFNINICNECGTEEAMMELFDRVPLSIVDWWIVNLIK